VGVKGALPKSLAGFGGVVRKGGGNGLVWCWDSVRDTIWFVGEYGCGVCWMWMYVNEIEVVFIIVVCGLLLVVLWGGGSGGWCCLM